MISRHSDGNPVAKGPRFRQTRDDEFAELSEYAEHRGLPVSTVVRALVLQAIAAPDDLKARQARERPSRRTPQSIQGVLLRFVANG